MFGRRKHLLPLPGFEIHMVKTLASLSTLYNDYCNNSINLGINGHLTLLLVFLFHFSSFGSFDCRYIPQLLQRRDSPHRAPATSPVRLQIFLPRPYPRHLSTLLNNAFFKKLGCKTHVRPYSSSWAGNELVFNRWDLGGFLISHILVLIPILH
jgi:hypothetical protein